MLIVLSGMVAFFVCTLEICSGDIATGLSFNLITRSDTQVGKQGTSVLEQFITVELIYLYLIASSYK